MTYLTDEFDSEGPDLITASFHNPNNIWVLESTLRVKIIQIFFFFSCSCESVKDDGICWRAASKLTEGSGKRRAKDVSMALKEKS